MKKLKFSFELQKTDDSGARAGLINTEHGIIETPMFMPVGTAAAMKAMTTEHLKQTGAQIMLSNAYHLNLQPGSKIVKKMGGLHQFMDWQKPILTDSGGFQVFSLPKKEISDAGVFFKNQISGDDIFISPEDSMQIQMDLGADIIMAFDQCVSKDADHLHAKKALYRTLNWAERSLNATHNTWQAVFGISQGSFFKDLRIEGLTELKKLNFDGYALGGLSVGEGLSVMKNVMAFSVPHMPENKPRYIMGIGLPEDILAAVEAGLDMFDCIIPTKYARSGVLFTYGGRLRIRSNKYKHDKYPVDTKGYSYTAKKFSRAYLHHLYKSNEILAAILGSIHNVHFFIDFVKNLRLAILKNEFKTYKKNFLEQYSKKENP